jgi:hypothetical protein
MINTKILNSHPVRSSQRQRNSGFSLPAEGWEHGNRRHFHQTPQATVLPQLQSPDIGSGTVANLKRNLNSCYFAVLEIIFSNFIPKSVKLIQIYI